MMTTQTAPLTATFARLRDGSWGLRISGRVTAGQTVVAVTRDGRRETKTIGSVLCQATGDQPALCTIGSARPSSPVRRPLRNGDEYTSRRTGERAIFGCADCTRLGRMCRSCQHDDE